MFGSNPFLIAAVAVVAPKAAINVLFCLNSGKFLNNDSIRNVSNTISYETELFFLDELNSSLNNLVETNNEK